MKYSTVFFLIFLSILSSSLIYITNEVIEEKLKELEIQPPKKFNKPSRSSHLRPVFPRGDCHVLVGPVIGTVTQTSARILFELSETNANFTVKLHSKTGEEIEETKRLEKGTPTIFHFSDLKSDTEYRVQVYGCKKDVTSRFRTLHSPQMSHPRPLNIAFISCNHIRFLQAEIPPQLNLWHLLSTFVNREDYEVFETDYVLSTSQSFPKNVTVDLIVHLGDQVYADSTRDNQIYCSYCHVKKFHSLYRLFIFFRQRNSFKRRQESSGMTHE